MKTLMLVVAFAAVIGAGCKKKKPQEAPVPAGSPKGSGSAGSGSAMGSGSAGSGSAGSAAAAKPMTPDQLAKQFATCWKAFSDSKWDAFKKCYASDAVDEMPGTGMPPANGADAIVKTGKMYKTPFPDLKGQSQLVLVDGHAVVGLTLTTGTNTGPFSVPGMPPMKPTNKKIGLYMAQVIDFNDQGQITHERDFQDVGTMLRQIQPNPGKHPLRKAMDKLPMPAQVVIAKDDATEKANLDVASKLRDAFNKHDVKAYMAMFAKGATWSEQSETKDENDKALTKDVEHFWKAFKDAKLTADKQWAAGDFVAVTGSMQGTNTGPILNTGIKKATGKKIDVPYLLLLEVQKGKVKNAWLFDQAIAFAKQLGLMKAPAAKGKKAAMSKKAAKGKKAAKK